MNIPRSSLEQDDSINSLNYEGIAMVGCGFTTFLTVTGGPCWLITED